MNKYNMYSYVYVIILCKTFFGVGMVFYFSEVRYIIIFYSKYCSNNKNCKTYFYQQVSLY